MTDDDRLKSLEARMTRFEAAHTAAAPTPGEILTLHPAWPAGLGLIALAIGYLGLGLPQHYYQPLFAALFLLPALLRPAVALAAGRAQFPVAGIGVQAAARRGLKLSVRMAQGPDHAAGTANG
jgi:hypothetical protein